MRTSPVAVFAVLLGFIEKSTLASREGRRALGLAKACAILGVLGSGLATGQDVTVTPTKAEKFLELGGQTVTYGVGEITVQYTVDGAPRSGTVRVSLPSPQATVACQGGSGRCLATPQLRITHTF